MLQNHRKYKKRIIGTLVASLMVMVIVILFSLYLDGDQTGPVLEGQVGSFSFDSAGEMPPLEPWYADSGEALTLKQFRNRVVMVNFWATWCIPCIQELPSIERLQSTLPEEKFKVVAINIDQEGAAKAQELLDRLRIRKLDLYVDPSGIVSRSMRVKAMPTTIIYGPDGRERGRLIGAAEWDSEEAIALLSYYIDLP